MSNNLEILKSKCRQLKQVDVAIAKVNKDILSLDNKFDTEGMVMLQILADNNRTLASQRKECRESIILLSTEIFGD
ncbi:hypothetical protein NVP1121O_229 [Vibrio phage 1.121.O._10N.286.46.C4]|nr:hypothetical protein NVP1121O_229 [Vibrio phage 1.121.O._10N.286.46.C4]